MSPGHGGIVSDVDVLATGDSNVNADAIGVALVVAMLGTRDDHTRRCDAIVKALDLLCLFAHHRFQRLGMADVLETDLEGYLHDLGPCRGLGACAEKLWLGAGG